MSFIKQTISDLLKSLSELKGRQEKEQTAITQLVANAVYYSVKDRNIDPGLKLFGALSSNGYTRTNDCITYLCKMGNFTYNKKDGLKFKQQFLPELADEIAETCVSNPMFTVVKEPPVRTEVDLLKEYHAFMKRMQKRMDEVVGNHGSISHPEVLEKLKAAIA